MKAAQGTTEEESVPALFFLRVPEAVHLSTVTYFSLAGLGWAANCIKIQVKLNTTKLIRQA